MCAVASSRQWLQNRLSGKNERMGLGTFPFNICRPAVCCIMPSAAGRLVFSPLIRVIASLQCPETSVSRFCLSSCFPVCHVLPAKKSEKKSLVILHGNSFCPTFAPAFPAGRVARWVHGIRDTASGKSGEKKFRFPLAVPGKALTFAPAFAWEAMIFERLVDTTTQRGKSST